MAVSLLVNWLANCCRRSFLPLLSATTGHKSWIFAVLPVAATSDKPEGCPTSVARITKTLTTALTIPSAE